ncbi:uncharacterized protein [Montipora capricornis]|uniref:uncharacterized protein n=1 Tax=Montipora capricornis TaxID=246305 RepID=UPI0035F1D3C0
MRASSLIRKAHVLWLLSNKLSSHYDVVGYSCIVVSEHRQDKQKQHGLRDKRGSDNIEHTISGQTPVKMLAYPGLLFFKTPNIPFSAFGGSKLRSFFEMECFKLVAFGCHRITEKLNMC